MATEFALAVVQETLERLDSCQNGDYSGILLRLEYLNRTIINCGHLPDSIVAGIGSAIAFLLCAQILSVPCTYRANRLLTGRGGHPPFHVSEDQLVFPIGSGFTVPKINELLGISKKTVERRMSDFGITISACNVDISIDGYDVGGWIMQGGQQFTIERSAYEAKKFTFYRVKKAPKDAGIDPSRKEENGVVKCVFTPEAFVEIPVTISGSSQPLMISFAPSATVGDLKEKIQQQLNKSPDPNQILAQNNKEFENHVPVRRVIESPESLILVDVELDVTVEASTNERFQVKIRPGEAKIMDLMQKIEAELEVPIKDQKLFYGKTRLSDNPRKGLPKELVYSLNRTVVVIVPDYIEVTIENSAIGESVTLKIDKEKRLTDLVREIPSCRNMDDNQEAIFLVDGRKLSPVQDTETLTRLGICSGSRVKLEVRVLFLEVFVFGLPHDQWLTVHCNPLETFQDLLNHVQSRTKLEEIGDATFSTKGRDFNPKEDMDTLQDYGIQHRSTLVFKMEDPHSSEDQLRDQLVKEEEEEQGLGRPHKLGAVRNERQNRYDDVIERQSLSSNSVAERQSSRVLTTNDPLWRAGGTTLQGHSYQLFEPTDDPITADPSKKIELVLRLVAREDEPDVMFPTDPCTPLSTLRPPPVPE